MSDIDLPIETAPATPAPDIDSTIVRLLLGLAGLFLLLITSVFTIGSAFVGALGVFVGAVVAKRTRKPLTLFRAWMFASAAVVLYAIGGATWVVQRLPEGSLEKIRQAADSASAVQETPAWLERVAPGTAARAQNPTAFDDKLVAISGVYGAILGVAIVLALFSTVGWGCAMLIKVALTGRWVGP